MMANIAEDVGRSRSPSGGMVHALLESPGFAEQ